ncbi:MAG: PAS domain S-box protein [Polyangiaceae bacterium]|nr:PAS domain S-box protein [Polyangiaceae bacterium]
MGGRAGGAPYDIEHRLLVGGETKWVRDKADLEFDEQNVLIGDAIISMGDDGRITLFNEGAEKIYGYSKTEVIGAPLEMLIPERFRAAHRRYVERFAAAPEVAHRMAGRGMKIFGLRKNGEEFPADAAVSKVVVDGTRVFTVILRDITEQQRAEDEIRQTQERFELALKGADMATWDWNIETGEVVFNARWAEMRGFRPDEIKPHVDTWIAGMHPDDWPHVQKALDDYFNGVVPEYRMEFRIRTKSGQWIWILDQGKIFARDEKGKPTRMVGTEIDITDQKRIEHEHKLLAEVGSMFASTLDYEETLSNVAQLVVRDIADFCIVDVLEDGEVRRVKVASRDLLKAPLCEVLQHTPLDRSRPSFFTEAIVHRHPVLMERLSPEMVESLSQNEQHLQALRAIDPQSVIAVPLMAHGALMGAMALVSATPSRVYDREDLRLAEELAHRAALSIDNARLYRAAGRAIQA